jgi:hypothetical protein
MSSRSNLGSSEQRGLSKTLLVSAVAGALTAMSDGALASCDSERETCTKGCFNGWYEQYTQCNNEHTEKFNDCTTWWTMLTQTSEERAECRRAAYAEKDECVKSAEGTHDWCKNACKENWESCTS